MALYNNGFPATYPYYGVPNMGQFQQPTQQIQQGGFVSVRSEDEARNYPIALGNSVTFKDENAPYVYVKTMGFSQLDRPRFEKFRLVREEAEISKISDDKLEADKIYDYARKSDLEAIQGASEAFQSRLESVESDLEDLRTKISEFFSKKGDKK